MFADSRKVTEDIIIIMYKRDGGLLNISYIR